MQKYVIGHQNNSPWVGEKKQKKLIYLALVLSFLKTDIFKYLHSGKPVKKESFPK